jgi:transposase
MSRFKDYSPDQAYLLSPRVRDELGSDHLCFFIRGVIERLYMRVFEQSYSAEGGELYAPQLMLGVWLYAYALGITSARQVERRLVEDLAFRYLAGQARIDNWALSAFRRRHGRALNDAITQVLEWAQSQGMVKLGRVAIDSTRVQANASRDRVDSEQALRDTRARLRRQALAWQKEADHGDQEPGGLEVAIGELNQALAQMPRRPERLKKSGLKKLSQRRRRAFPAPARRQVRARLLGRDRRLRRPPDRGPTGDPERDRQPVAPAHAARGGTTLQSASGCGSCRQRPNVTSCNSRRSHAVTEAPFV